MLVWETVRENEIDRWTEEPSVLVSVLTTFIHLVFPYICRMCWWFSFDFCFQVCRSIWGFFLDMLYRVAMFLSSMEVSHWCNVGISRLRWPSLPQARLTPWTLSSVFSFSISNMFGFALSWTFSVLLLFAYCSLLVY